MGNVPGNEKKKHRPSSIRESKQTKLGDEAEVEFESKLAEGTTATAYKGIWSGKEVAIKQFREEGEQIEFLRELLILSKVRHPNVITYFSSNATKRFVVLEFMVNGTLHDALQSDHALSWPDRISIGYDLVNAMSYLHSNGIIHCDLRPSNCLVVSFYPYKVKVFDFSSSKMINDTDINEGIWGGDIRFQPPEVCRRRLDSKSTTFSAFEIGHPFAVDSFSFGMTLYSLITRREPLPEFKEDYSAVARHIVDGNRPKMPSTEEVPTQYADVIKRCWDSDPTRRPTFDELLPVFQQLDIHGPQLQIKTHDV